jgi:hypothetical protein
MKPKLKIELLPDGIARVTIEEPSKNRDGRRILAERKIAKTDADAVKAALALAVKGTDWQTGEPNAGALRREMAQRIIAEYLGERPGPGRPHGTTRVPADERAVKQTVSLRPRHIATAKRLGAGNVSKGIQEALDLVD